LLACQTKMYCHSYCILLPVIIFSSLFVVATQSDVVNERVTVVETGFQSNNNRPPVNQRNFTSPIIEAVINETASRMKSTKLATLFVNCFPNTLDTTVNFTYVNGQPDTFVVTGDIKAMWLRDSSAQVDPYIPYITRDSRLKDLIRGVINRQTRYINVDVYANAFNRINGPSPNSHDIRYPPMNHSALLFEGKYELDSLAWVMRLSTRYYEYTKDSTLCTDSEWKKAVWRMINAIVYQQNSTASMSPRDRWYYSFSRWTTQQTETLENGIGIPGRRCGMSRSPFRPSDDAHRNPYPIAANAMTVVGLRKISDIFSKDIRCRDNVLASAAKQLADEIDEGIRTWGVVNHPKFGLIYAYEVDGFGSYLPAACTHSL
jgi:meiotically up-regulated gene 157 (Mug157) protein